MVGAIVVYQDTLALRENPFGPRAGSLSSRLDDIPYVANTDSQPLRVDKCAALDQLLCRDIAFFPKAEEEFREFLEALSYDFDAGEPGDDSAIFLLRGAQGVGKTTLAAHFIRTVVDTFKSPGDGSNWRAFDLEKPQDPLTGWTRQEFQIALEKLRATVGAAPPGVRLLILLEDITSDTLGYVLRYYDVDLRSARKLLFVTTHDLALMDRDALNVTQKVKLFSLPSIAPADAEIFVQSRLEAFRDPRLASIDLMSPVFPWSLDRLRMYVQNLAIDGSASPITLRVLAGHLRSKISEHHNRLKRSGIGSVRTALAEDLPRYLIDE